MSWRTFISNIFGSNKDDDKKKNHKLSSAAHARVVNQTPRTNSYGVTQNDVNEVQSRRIQSTQRKQESERETAPAPTTGVGRLGAITKYKGQMGTTGTTTYFEEEKRASERMKERGKSSYHDVKGEGVVHQTPYQRHLADSGKIKSKTSAGTRKTYRNPDGSVGYYYEKQDHGFKSQRQYYETGDERYLTGETGKKPVASGIKSKFGIDRSERFYTQESPNTLKYDDGKKTEYYERQGDRYVSVPEERYNQVRLLNSGRNPSDYSFDKRAADRAKAAGQNIKAAVKGVGVSTNVGRENKGYQLAMQYVDGKNLSEKQESFMRGTKAGQAVLKGDYRTARELVNQETRERQLAEQGVLREQEKANMRAEISKIGASKPAQFALDVGGTALEMAPGMAMNAVAPGTFLAEMAFQSYGNSYNNARLQGASHNEAVVSGLQNAAVETLSEMMFAGGKTLGKMTGVKGIFHPAKEIEDASLAFIKTTSGRDIVRTAQKLGLASAEEGAEELVAGIVEPIMDNLIYQHEDMNSEWWEQTIHDALYNTLIGAAMGGGFGVADVVQSYRSGEAIREHADVANMINTGLSMPEDSASYMLARRLDVQTRSNPEMLGNIDTAELNAALQKDMQKVQENYDKEMETTKRSLAKKGLENVRTHAERDYVVSSNRDEDAANGEITEEEAKVYHSTLGDKFGAIYERARDSIASKIQRAPSEEATEEDVESMYEEAKADASSPARSIAKILTGEGTAADTANLMVSNPAAREVFEEISGQRLPANNADTIAMLNRINATNNQVSTEIQASENREQSDKNITGKVVAEARTVLGRTNHAVDVFYDMTASIPDEDLYAAKDEFVSLYDAGTRSNDEFDLERDLREPSVLSIEQQRIAFNEGAKARGVRIEKVKSREKKIESAKKSGRKRDVTSNDVKSKLNDNEQKKAKKLGLADVADELQKSLHTTFVLESNRSIDEASDSGVSGAHTNGWYDPSDDTIHLNIDAVRPLDVVFSHEFTHHLQQYAPKEYQDLIDYIKKEKANNSESAWQRMIDSKMEEYERGGVLLKSRDDAVDEIVADMAYEFLNDERAMHRLFGYDKDLATKIRQTILDVIDRLLEVLKNYTSIAGSQWKGMEEQLEGARERWLKAAEAARENSKLDIAGDDGVQFMIEDAKNRNQNAQKEQKQLSLSSLGMTERNGRAAWLPERIDQLMREYGSSDPKYSKAFAAMISPRDYLKLTLGDRYLDMWNEGAKDHDNMDMRQLSEEDLRKETQTPFLTIYSRDGMNVQGHEGRHRMRALMEAGITSVPVVIQDPDTKYTKPSLPSMTLYSQDFGKGPVNGNAAVTVTNVVPITRYNRDELIEKFGAKDNDQVQFSVSAEEDQKYLDLVKKGDLKKAQKMVDEAAKRSGYSIESFHGTRAKFSKFKPNSHFGTKIYQALDRLGFYNDILDEYEDEPEIQALLNRAENSGAVVMRLYIKANNPIEVSDFGNWDFDYLIRYLPEYLPDSDIDWASLKSASDVISALKNEGYDSIVYENTHEGRDDDEGDNNAFILFDPHQAKLADPVTYDDAGNVIPLSKRFDESQNDIRYSISDQAYEAAVKRGDMSTVRSMVAQAAQKAGYKYHGYHGSNAMFTRFDPEKLGSKNFMAGSAYLGFFASGSRETAESYIGLNSMDIFGASLSEESMKIMDDIKQRRGFEKRLAEYNQQKERFEEQYKADHGYKEEVEDKLNYFMENAGALDLDSEANKRLRDNLQMHLQYEWNDKNLNAMESAWRQTDEHKAFQAFDEEIFSEWEPTELKRRGFTPNVKELYIKLDNPLVYDFKGEGRDPDSFAARMAEAKRDGKDGCIFLNVSDGADLDTIYTVFNNTQFKSADPVVYDDAGKMIPLSERFNDTNEDIRYSLKSREQIEMDLSNHFDVYKEDKKALDIAVDAVSDLQKVRVGNTSGIRTIANGIRGDLVNKGYVDFRGKKVNSPQELAELAQILRDPRYETSRMFYMKNNKIVAVDNVSSRLPATSLVTTLDSAQEWYEYVERKMKRLGADGYYLMHNHPSGDVTASGADRRVTRDLAANVSGFLGHIILDHDKFGLLSYSGDFSEMEIGGQGTIDLLHQASVDHPLLGKQISRADDLAEIGKQLLGSKDVTHIIYLTAPGEICEIQEVSNSVISHDKNFGNYLRNEMVRSGAYRVFFATQSDHIFTRTGKYIENQIALDVVKLAEGRDAIYGRTYVDPENGYDHGLTEAEIKKRTIKYSLSEDSDGRALTAEQQDFFKNSKIRDDQGRLKVMYHGTKNDFTVFKFDQGGKNGRAEGFGIYLSDNPEVSRHYGERMIEGYVNIARPARSDQRTIKRAELKRLIKAAVNADAERWDMDGRDTWISNYTNTYEKSLDASISDVADMILGSNENDMDIVQEVMAGMGIRDYDDAITFYDMLTDVTGIDGFVTEWENQETGEPSQIVLAFRSNQIKNATNKMPTDDPDIRYSIDTKGRSLTEGQKTFFKNSKARDEDGRLRVLYHSSPEQFYEFDNERLGSNTGYANTAFGHFVTDYLPFSERFGENQMELYANIENLAVHPFGAAAKYSGDELEQITRDWLELTDPEQLNVYEEYKQDDPDLSLYDFYMDLWVGDDPFDYADDQRELLENAGYDGIELFEGNENQLSADNTGEEKPVTTYAVFNSNQLKDVDNKMPTKSPDIRYSINTPIKELDHTDKTVTDKNGNPVAKFDKAGGVQFSISTYEGMGREILNKYLNNMVLQGDMDQDEADQIRDELEKVYDICKEYADTKKYVPFTAWSYAEVVRGANGRPVFSAIKNNSEYKMNIDFSTICKKRRTLDAIFNELVNRGFFDRLDLNKEDSAAFVVKMNDIIRKNGFEAACALCFVEARRYRQQQTAMTFRDMWNDLVKSMYKDESKISHFNFGKDKTARIVEDGIHTMKDSDLDLTYVKKVANSKGVPSRAAKLLLEDPSQRKLMRTGDMMSSVGFENLQVNNPKLMKIYNAKKGTGGAKSSFGDVQYFHEMIGSRNKTFNRNKAYKVGGVRIQSFSDYVPRMVFDYVEMVADLAAKRLPAHAYTKEALFAKQFGLTGIKINLSLVPDVVKGGKAVGLDKNGNYAWNEEGTFPYNEAEKLIKAEGYKDNVGTIAVGVSDEQIRKMLADPNIMMVIPYHKSSLNPIVAEMTNVDAFTDYTDFQNTKDENGKTVKRDFDWDGKLHKLSHGRDGKLLPKDQWGNIQDVVKEYADWCKARNYTPKFSQFLYMKNGSINPGYYKMLEDFSLLSVDGEFTPQDDVRMRFPTETDAFGSMADLIAEGLDADANLEGRRSVRVAPIADEIESLAESGELLADLNQRDVDIVKNFMETADVTKGHQPQFSLVSDRDREIANLQKKVDRLKRDKRRTYGREAKEGDAVRVAKAILRDTSSDYSLNQTIKGIKNVFQMIRRGDDFSEIYGELQGLARSIADSSYDMVEIPGAREDAELRQRFLDTRKRNGGSPLKILIPQNLVGDFDRVGGWKEFRAAHKGIVTLSVNSGESYDTFVDSIAEEFGEQYRAVGDNSGIDSLIKIIETADSQEARNPERKVYKDEDLTGEIPDDVDMGIMGGWRDEEVNSIIDRLLDDINTEIMPDLTFADRKAAEKDEAVRRSVNREREKWEARREKWNADRDKRIAEMKEDKKLAVEAQRAEGKERLRKQAEMYRRQREKSQQRRAETASRRKLLNHINRTAQRLSQKLLKPTDNQHIPEKYRKAVADMLGWLDFENARTDAWAKRHGNVPSERILNMRKLKDIYAKIADDEQLNKYIEPDDQINEWLDFLSDIEGSRLDDLDTEQLKTVRLVLDAVSWQVNNADKALTEGLKQNRADIATQLMNELEAQKGEKLSDGMLKKFIKADSTPVHFFDRLGLNTLKTIYKELTVAQDKHIKNLSEAQDYIEKNITSKFGNTRKVGPNNSLIKKWTEEAQKYKLENGKTVEMTGAQVMSLYALNKREQARKHLLGGGIVIAPTKVKRNLKGGIKEYLLERELQKTRAELSYADITSILSKMSQEQIDAAEAMLKYLKTTSEWGNETSMKLYGYRKFTEENYFPIQSAKEFIAGSNLELQRDKKIKNQGMTKQVNEYANNPIVIDDFFEVTTAHINQMSQYNSFVPILEDFDKIYQYNEYDPDTKKYHRSVKELIEQKHGRWAADYIETLMKNVNGNYGNEVADIQGFDKLLRNWKAAKIGLSIRVLAQQPTAVARAFNEIDPKYFVGTPKRHSHKRMWEICPIAEWKHWGYSQTDIHRSMRDTMMGDKHLSDKLFFDMYGMADDLGWGMIFDAVERETKAQMKKGKLKFKYDDADYRKHVNERFRQIVDRTQVVDSVLHRSQLMRSQNTFTKAMTSFMAEPTISINTIMSAFAKSQQEARAGHKGAAVKAATRGISVFVANAVAVSMMASLISAIRESYLPDDDDDEEKELTKLQQLLIAHGVEEGSLLYDWISGYFIEDFKSNINPFALIPVTKDLLNMYQGFDAPNPMYALPESIIKNVKNIKNWIDEDGDTRYSGRYYIERAAESVAELFGVPAANIRKELIGFQNIYFRAISEKDYGDYLQDRWELNEDYKGNKNLFIDHYLNAKKAGHDDSARDIKQQLLSSGARDSDGKKVFTDEAIQKRAWSVYAPNYKEDIIAGKNVVAQESNLRKVGVSQEDIDDKKSKAMTAALSDAVAAGDMKRLDDLRKSLSKYGYGDYDIDKKIKSEANSLLYDAIDAGKYNDADKYIKIITDGTEYTRKDVVSTITSHYMSDYYEALDTNDTDARDRCKSILKKYGMTDKEINMTEGAHYKDYYKAKVYAALQRGDTEEAYRIANWYVDKYPNKLENGEVKPNFQKGAEGMIFGLSRTSDSKIREYTTSDKYVTWEIPW